MNKNFCIKRRIFVIITAISFVSVISFVSQGKAISSQELNKQNAGKIINNHAENALNYLQKLREDMNVGAFQVKAVYLNARGKRIGARFIHKKNRMPVDLLIIDSVPQMLVTVLTPPPSNKGEAHTGEHLVLGKGAKGKYMSLAMQMKLSNNTAATYPDVTAFQFYTASGAETFYSVMTSFFDTLMKPDFSDEEIKREVCHVGVFRNPKTNLLYLDEKGTIYNEMVNTAEKPSFYIWKVIRKTLYGENNPLGKVAGGIPSEIRKITPEEIRAFHDYCYRFGPTVNPIIVVPNNFDIEQLLSKLNKIVKSLSKNVSSFEKVPVIPPFQPSKDNEKIRIVLYPGLNANATGEAYFAWAPNEKLGFKDVFLLQILMDLLADGETSFLYKDLIANQTSQLEYHPVDLSAFVYNIPGYPIFIYVGGFSPIAVNESYLSSLRKIIVKRLNWLHDVKDGSPELCEINRRFSLLSKAKFRDLKKQAESPPMFGYRGTDIWWHRHLTLINKNSGFEKSLIEQKMIESLKKKIASKRNFYRDILDESKLMKKPFVFSAQPNPFMIDSFRKSKKKRMKAFSEFLKNKYEIDDEQFAFLMYKQEIQKKTEIIEQRDTSIKKPSFVNDPPMTLDTAIHFKQERLLNRIPFVWSEFNNTSFNELGLNFNLRFLSKKYYKYLVLLPDLILKTGVISEDGKLISYYNMKDALTEQLYDLNADFRTAPSKGNVEFRIYGKGSSVAEGKNVVTWLQNVLLRPQITTSNRIRINEIIEQKLNYLRNIMNYPEEYWVSGVANAVKYSDDDLYLATSSVITQLHEINRLSWQIKIPPAGERAKLLKTFLVNFEQNTKKYSRKQIIDILMKLLKLRNYNISPNKENDFYELISIYLQLIKSSSTNNEKADVNKMLSYLLKVSSNSSDDTMKEVCQTVVREIIEDWWSNPDTMLRNCHNMLKELIKKCDFHGFFTGNKNDEKILKPYIEKLILKIPVFKKRKFNKKKIYAFHGNSIILNNLKDKYDLAKNNKLPHFIALVKNDTRNGAFINSAPGFNYDDLNTEKLKQYLSTALFSGSGNHSLFMQTWAAGLAYSNGISASLHSGNINYYAERCNDLSETMKFISSLLNNASKHIDSDYYLSYALAVMFNNNFASRDYFARGRRITNDIFDGITPEKVYNYRSRILKLQNQPKLLSELLDYLPQTVGSVVVGYGNSISKTKGSLVFIIAPEFQIKSFERYLQQKERNEKIYRLQQADFWMKN